MLTGHLLLGLPLSAQAAIIEQLQQQIPNLCLISAALLDHKNCLDDPASLCLHIQRAIAQNQSVVIAASTAPRPWRMTLLQQTQSLPIAWIGWQLPLPPKPAPKPEGALSAAVLAQLKQFPPSAAEGFLACYTLDPKSPTLSADIARRLKNIPRSQTNRTNRTEHTQVTFHPYSALLDFDRLLHLISLLVQYPGLGSFHSTDTALLASLLHPRRNPDRKNSPKSKDLPQNSLDEICAVIAAQRGELYADSFKLAADLDWLAQNGFLQPQATATPLSLKQRDRPSTAPHTYSDREPFERLLTTLRFITHHPLLWQASQGSLHSLLSAMQAEGILHQQAKDTLRKDIEKVFKPYQLLSSIPMKRGYFIGTGILCEVQLMQLYRMLRAQAQTLEDPTSLDLLEQFTQRLQYSQRLKETPYPVKTIANRPILNPALLPSSALPHTLSQLEQDIEQGRLLELNCFSGVGNFGDKPEGFFLAWPLQIVFYNIAWYLGYEMADNRSKPGLLQFQRLDRLFRGRPQTKTRDRAKQLAALARLQSLQSLCSGLYLGTDCQEQQQVLSKRSQRETAFTTLELWFSDRVFKFVSEGSQRFHPQQMQMSPRPGTAIQSDKAERLYCLKPSPDASYPHRLRVSLPNWSVDDVDLRRWIIGFGNQVKVMEPASLISKIKEIGQSVAELYED